ncbi:MAG: lipoyl synthase [Candidatus Gastranaerophilales bacterium]|nr:lipoyl synthase [Candidatus Gastranaerophilales bacterium]
MKRLPDYLKRPIIDTEKTKTVRHILKSKHLNTVCEGARCPNKNECYQHNTATFLIMGNICTRNCKYCNISTAKPEALDKDEPLHVAEAIKELGLDYAVITSVTRDDIPDGGAEHFAKCIEETRKLCPNIKIEILTPDFRSRKSRTEFNKDALDAIITSAPDVFNHNIETARDVFESARPLGNYDLSLSVLKYVKDNSNIPTKSGLMIGLGETTEQILETFKDLRSVGCDILTVGQYIQPSKQHLEVEKFYRLEEYDYLKEKAKEFGFKKYQIGPLVRSSYHAKMIMDE